MAISHRHYNLARHEVQGKDFAGVTAIPIEQYMKHDYYQKIAESLKRKTILDVGCVDDGETNANQVRLWNHWFISQVGKSVLGIDVRDQPLQQLKKLGFKVLRMDAQDIRLRKKFDIVFAGELIEHLPNPGLFLTGAAKVLKKDGQIILSTPNPFSLSRLVRALQLLTNEPPVNPDHTMYLSPQNIQTLVRKCGLRVVKIEYAHFPFTKQSWLVRLNQIGCKILGAKFKEQIIAFVGKI